MDQKKCRRSGMCRSLPCHLFLRHRSTDRIVGVPWGCRFCIVYALDCPVIDSAQTGETATLQAPGVDACGASPCQANKRLPRVTMASMPSATARMLPRLRIGASARNSSPSVSAKIFRQRIAVLSVVHAPPQLYAGLRKPPQHPVFNQFEVAAAEAQRHVVGDTTCGVADCGHLPNFMFGIDRAVTAHPQFVPGCGFRCLDLDDSLQARHLRFYLPPWPTHKQRRSRTGISAR